MSTAKRLHAVSIRIVITCAIMVAMVAGALLVIATECQAGGRGAWKMDDFQYPSWNYDRFHIKAWGGPWVPSAHDPCEGVIIDYVAAGFNAIRADMTADTLYITPAVQYRLAEKYDLALIDYDSWDIHMRKLINRPSIGTYCKISFRHDS